MRILYHHRTRSEDAQGIHINEMVRAFRSLGHEVEMVSLVQSQGQRVDPVRSDGFWKRATPRVPGWIYELMSLAYNVWGYRRLARAIRQRRPDLIYERYSLNTVCGVLAGRRFGIPFVLEVNSPLCYEQSLLGALTFRRLARRIERWICSHSTRTIVVSAVMRNMLVDDGVAAANLVVMPNGVDPKQFSPEVSGTAVRRRYGLDGKVVVGVVGWFRPWHGVEMLVESMHEGGMFDGGVGLLLVGDGPAYAGVHRYAAAHGLLDSIAFAGPVDRDEIPAHIAAMDVAVQPSANEYACPMKIVEYMAMGRCIVAPDQPNIRELLGYPGVAFLFSRDDRSGLRTALAEVIHDPRKRQRAGELARASVLERQLLWQANAQRVLDLVVEADASVGRVGGVPAEG
jgi:glycosyltransferase involved in cell wall biosynthesis